MGARPIIPDPGAFARGELTMEHVPPKDPKEFEAVGARTVKPAPYRCEHCGDSTANLWLVWSRRQLRCGQHRGRGTYRRGWPIDQDALISSDTFDLALFRFRNHLGWADQADADLAARLRTLWEACHAPGGRAERMGVVRRGDPDPRRQPRDPHWPALGRDA